MNAIYIPIILSHTFISLFSQTWLKYLILPPPKRYQRVEKTEEIQRRNRKEKENVTLGVISKIMKSDHLRDTFKAALDTKEDEEAEEGSSVVTVKDFTRLRDAIIMKFMIVSLKRAMEFCEFTLGEFTEIEMRSDESGDNSYVIRVANHKTATQGRS